MNTDIRLATSFVGHRKRRRLKRLIGPGYLDHLIDLWLRIAVTRPDGELKGWTVEDIADEANYDGDAQEFVDALVKSGWFEFDNRKKHYRPHDWKEYQSWAIDAPKRSQKARKAAKARWDKRFNSEQPADNNKDSNNATSMPGACPEHSGEHAGSNAPTLPYPILSSIDFTNVKSKHKSSQHFNQVVGQFLEPIKEACEKIKTMPNKNGSRFNAYEFVQKMINDRQHPGAILQTLEGMIRQWARIASPWPYANKTMKRLNGNYNEADAIIESERFKKGLAELADMLKSQG